MDKKQISVVLLGYKSRAGKDTVYSFIKDLGFTRVAFADKLKSIANDLYDLSDEQSKGSLKDVMDGRYINKRDKKLIPFNYTDGYGRNISSAKPNPDWKPNFTSRRIYQLFGGDSRSIWEDVFAAYVFRVTIPALIKQGHTKFVVTDFRFRNEYEVSKRWATQTNSNLYTYRIDRPEIESKTAPNDVSENDLNSFTEWTGKILNDRTLDDLKQKSLEIFSKL